MAQLIYFFTHLFATPSMRSVYPSFWPMIILTDIIKSVPDAQQHFVSSDCALTAIIRVNQQLELAQFALKTMGYAHFSDYINRAIKEADKSELLSLHKKAVISRVRAGLDFKDEQRFLQESSYFIDCICRAVSTSTDSFQKK